MKKLFAVVISFAAISGCQNAAEMRMEEIQDVKIRNLQAQTAANTQDIGKAFSAIAMISNGSLVVKPTPVEIKPVPTELPKPNTIGAVIDALKVATQAIPAPFGYVTAGILAILSGFVAKKK